jgi:DtxR family Mn-dependent transcriptional regulator
VIVRRHRLAERLLADALKMTVQDVERDACEFEHVLAPEVTESICTLLGHPRECPHGRPIPEGDCCRAAKNVVDNVVISLDKLEAGQTARIVYLKTQSHPRLHKLLAFGIGPGARITVHQKFPSFIVSLDRTTLALEKEVAQDIFVWRGKLEP